MSTPSSSTLKDKLLAFNLFPVTVKEIDPHTVLLGRIASYLLLISITTAMIIIMVYYSVTVRNVTITEQKPISLEKYQNLVKDYSPTLNCPCTQVAINYEKFISINPTYHQYCNSIFVTDDYIYSHWPQDAQTLSPSSLTSRFRMLATFCSLSIDTINDGLRGFYASNFVTGSVIQPTVFDPQAQSFIDLFKQTTIHSFNRSINLIRSFRDGDQVLLGNQLNFNTFVGYSYADGSYTDFYTAYSSKVFGGTCQCFYNSSCVDDKYITLYRNYIYSPSRNENITITGLRQGCSIIESLFRSNLWCFYNLTCAYELSNYYVSLNVSQPSQYSPETLIYDMVQEMFVEDWKSSKSYEQYFSTCEPSSCSYTKSIHREPIEILTTTFGLLGGLRTVLMVAMPILVSTMDSLIQKYRGGSSRNKDGDREITPDKNNNAELSFTDINPN